MKIKRWIRKMISPEMWAFFCRFYYNISLLISEVYCCVVRPKQLIIPQIPIIINNYNRLSDLKALISSLEVRGVTNIHILDNNSTYPPLLEYYQSCKYDVIKLNKNYGFLALWQSGVYDRFKGNYYVYTDSDMEIDPDCPSDFLEHFVSLFRKHPLCHKVGFGIRIDDLPDCFDLKEKVKEHESQFWENEIDFGVFDAVIDTTFALYRPYTKGASSPYKFMCRTGFPYLIRHLPWYVDSSNISEEELYYRNSCVQSTHWTQASRKK